MTRRKLSDIGGYNPATFGPPWRDEFTPAEEERQEVEQRAAERAAERGEQAPPVGSDDYGPDVQERDPDDPF